MLSGNASLTFIQGKRAVFLFPVWVKKCDSLYTSYEQAELDSKHVRKEGELMVLQETWHRCSLNDVNIAFNGHSHDLGLKLNKKEWTFAHHFSTSLTIN